MASATSSSTPTGSESSSGSSFCTRERSISSWTRLVSRVASFCMRPAKRSTASGSSAASRTASESRESAPTGVFSSWLTFATKSRRTASMRRASVRSSTRSSTSREPSGATRAETASASPPPRAAAWQIQLDLAYLAVPPGVAGHLEHRLDGELAAAHQPEGVRGGAGLDHGVGLVEHDGGGAQHGQDGVDAGREDGFGVQRRTGGPCLLALAPAERQHGDHAGAHPGDRCRCGDRRIHVHVSRLCASADSAPAESGRSSNTRPPEFTLRSWPVHLGGRTADAFRTERGSVEAPSLRRRPLPRDPCEGRTVMRDAYHEELDSISDSLVEMARLVGSAIGRATTAMLDADLKLAESVIAADEKVDDLQRDLETRAITAAGAAAAGRHRPADRRHLAADERRPGALRRPGAARRQGRAAALPRLARAAATSRRRSWRWGSSPSG